MKIAVLGTRGFPGVQGGVEKHCENLYPRLVEKGCEVICFSREPYTGKDVLWHKGVEIRPICCPKNKFLEAIVHTWKGILEANKLKPDILHIHAVGPALFVPFAKLFGLQVIMTHHGPDYERKKWNGIARLILKMGERNGCRKADEVICISEPIAQSIREKYCRNPIVIPNGVEISSKVETVEVLRRFGLEKGKYVLTVSRFVPEKGLHDIIEVQSPYKIVIVGDADHIDKYSRKLKEQAKMHQNVILTGRLTGLPLQELYSHAGLFVLPSYYEGLPIVLLEAMSYGLSCVVSDIPANREVQLSEERYFKPGDVKALGLKIKQFIGEKMGSAQIEAAYK